MTAVGSYRNGQIERYFPGDRITFKASAAVTGGRIVAISGNKTVAPAVAGSTAIIGIALFDAAVNEYVTVATIGVWDIRANAAVAAGDVLTTAGAGVDAGSVTPVTVATQDPRTIVGRAIEAAALGAVVGVYLTI